MRKGNIKILAAVTAGTLLLSPSLAHAEDYEDPRSKTWTTSTVEKEPEKATVGGTAGENIKKAEHQEAMRWKVASVEKKQVEPMIYGKGVNKDDATITPVANVGPEEPSSNVDVPEGGIKTNLDIFAKEQNGRPYGWGGPTGKNTDADCTGYVGELAALAKGKDPWKRLFYTGNQYTALKQLGFKSGLGPKGSYNIAWYNDQGGPGGGHSAGTLPSLVKIESGGAHNSMAYGGPAVGADDPQFKGRAPCTDAGEASCSGSAHLPPEFFIEYNKKIKPDQITW